MEFKMWLLQQESLTQGRTIKCPPHMSYQECENYKKKRLARLQKGISDQAKLHVATIPREKKIGPGWKGFIKAAWKDIFN